MNLNSSKFRKISIYSAQAVITGLLTILLFPIITTHLDPHIYGLYALSVVYASIFTGIANLGCIAGYERNFFLYESSSEKTADLLFSIQLFISCIFFLLIIFGWFTREYSANYLLNDSEYSMLWWLILCSTSLSSLAQYYLTYLKNVGLAYIYFVLTIIQAVINFLLIYIGLKFTEYGVMVLAYANIISSILLCVFIFVHQHKLLPAVIRCNLIFEVLKVSLPLTPKVLFGFMNTQFDKIMLGMISSIGDVGIYAVAQRIAQFIFTFMTALDHVFKPNVYRMLFEKSNNKVGNYLLLYMYLSVLPALLLILFSREIFSMLVTDNYLDGISVLVILCLYYSMMFFGKISGMQLIYAKKTWLTSKLMFIGIGLNVLLNIPLIIIWGIIGAAFATTLSSFIMLIVYNYFAQKHIKIDWDIKSIFNIYIYLFVSALYILITQSTVFHITYYYEMALKIMILVLFFSVGIKMNVINLDSYRTIKK